MADLIGPFDSADWAQTEWYSFAPAWAPSGIIGTPAASVGVGDFAVTASGLTLTVACNGDRAWIDGSGYKPDTDKTLAVTANANASLSRRDRLVIRRDLAAQTTAVIRLAGTPAGTPAAPPLTQVSGGVYDIPICSFLVPPNNGTALSGFIDERRWLLPESGGRNPVTRRSAFRPGGGSGNNIAGGGSADYGTATAGQIVLPAAAGYRDVDISVGFDLYCPTANAAAGDLQLYANGVAVGDAGTWSNHTSTTTFAARPVMAQARWAGALPADVQNIWVRVASDPGLAAFWIFAIDLTVIER